MELNDLIAAAQTIKVETGLDKNTHVRIGAMFENIINYFAENVSPAAATKIQEAIANSTTGIRKGMSVVWSRELGDIPVGFVLSNGNNGQPINGVTVPDYRSRFLIGYDSSKAQIPTNVTDHTENYGKAGNTGGKGSVLLLATQSGLPAHKHPIKIVGKNNGLKYVGYGSASNTPDPNSGAIDTDKNNAADAQQAHENRPPYYVVYWITKVSDDTTAEYNSAYDSYKSTTTDNPVKTEAEWVVSLGGDGKSAYAIAVDDGFMGTEVEWLLSLHGEDGADGADGANGISAYAIAVANGFIGTQAEWLVSLHGADGSDGSDGSSTETALYVLSGLDADITVGTKASHAVAEAHSFVATDIFLQSSAAPTDFDIIVDIKKNGVSIFTTKPKVPAGTLYNGVPPVLATSPTLFGLGDTRTVIVDQIGTSETGKNLVLSILMHK